MRLYEYSVNHAVCVTRPVLASMTMNEAGVRGVRGVKFLLGVTVCVLVCPNTTESARRRTRTLLQIEHLLILRISALCVAGAPVRRRSGAGQLPCRCALARRG